jgi:Zn-dependent protease with chaperone function
VLESQWRIALPAVFLAVVFVSVLFVWGIPFASKKIAYAIPESANETISKGTFETIDNFMLKPSQLPEGKRELIRHKFELLVENYSQSKFNYRLHFRKMGSEPNAFALPDGNIVITDRLVEYAGDKTEEVLAVLLHEIGHVEHRHGLRLAIEASSIALILSMIVGEFAVSDDLLITLPTILSTSAYSRDHEEEADDFALKYMQEAKLDPENFSNILAKIMHTQVDAGQGENCDNSEACEREKHIEKAFGYLSSHPVTEERILKARQAAKHYNQK